MTAEQELRFKRTFVINHAGSYAWQWSDSTNKIDLGDLPITVDQWKAKMEAAGYRVVDDRGKPGGNVWD